MWLQLHLTGLRFNYEHYQWMRTVCTNTGIVTCYSICIIILILRKLQVLSSQELGYVPYENYQLYVVEIDYPVPVSHIG